MGEHDNLPRSYRSPAPDRTGPTRLSARTWVVKWSGHTFTAPVPLIPRFEVRVGDRIDSSHHGAVYVERTTANERLADAIGSVQFWMRHLKVPTNVSQRPWTELYPDDSTVPLLERDGVVYGTPTGIGEGQRLWGTLMSSEEALDYSYPMPRFVDPNETTFVVSKVRLPAIPVLRFDVLFQGDPGEFETYTVEVEDTGDLRATKVNAAAKAFMEFTAKHPTMEPRRARWSIMTATPVEPARVTSFGNFD